jgi:hypothetical protein
LRPSCVLRWCSRFAAAFWFLTTSLPGGSLAQTAPEKQIASEEGENPAQITLLETRIRFDAEGSSRKEVHACARINSELGARQFARLNFDYNRAFESVEIPLVRITHASGGTVDMLPSAITDQPNSTVVEAPAYQDIRVKSVRILGLEPSDLLEYRVITTVSHHPLAPDFWLDHSFDRTGVVSEEIFEIDLPAALEVQLRVNPMYPYAIQKSESGGETRVLYHWQHSRTSKEAGLKEAADVVLTSFASWDRLAQKLALRFLPRAIPGDSLDLQATKLTREAKSKEEKLRTLYDFVSQGIRTIDLPLGALGYSARQFTEILASGYANPEEKAFLLAALCNQVGISAHPILAGAPDSAEQHPPAPSLFSRVLVLTRTPRGVRWLDPSLEVAPLGAIQANLRGKSGLLLVSARETLSEAERLWTAISSDLPFPSLQSVTVDAILSLDGKLNAKAHYSMRGDNELLLRVAFHQTPKEKWKDLAQLLSISDGFRGQVVNVSASNPSATLEPFTVDYEIVIPKFVDWSKRPVRIPALLPQLGLPEPPVKAIAGAALSPIGLGTPLEVKTLATLHLPSGTTARAPTGTSVERDYATFTSRYSANDSTTTASRHLNFLLREVAAARAADFSAFTRAVQNDEAQDFTLERPETTPARTDTPANPSTTPKPSHPEP